MLCGTGRRPRRHRRRSAGEGVPIQYFDDDLGPTLTRAIRALDATAGAVVVGSSVVAAVGPARWLPASELRNAGTGGTMPAVLDGCHALRVGFARSPDAADGLLLFRPRPFTTTEGEIAAALAQAAEAVHTLSERTRLLRRLSRIQRSISHRAPLQEVLDAVTAGVCELLGDSVSGVRLLDLHDPSVLHLASSAGLTPEQVMDMRVTPSGTGAGGRAVSEERLVLIEDYANAAAGIPTFQRRGLAIAMAAPIRTDGVVSGSLTIASFDPLRRYSSGEQEALLAFAEQVSLALNDAQALAAAREAEGVKDLFMAMVSHELKTPLTVMMGTLRTLQVHGAELAEEAVHRMLVTAFERGQDLDRLIEQLLQSARAELASQPAQHRLASLLDTALDGFDALVCLEVAEPPDLTLRIDPTAFHAVVGILLENAVKHASDRGPVTVAAELVPGAGEGRVEARRADGLRAEGRRAVVITIGNPGSLPDDITADELFQPFRRGPERLGGGVGLGLYIADRLAGAMGGSLACTSQQGTVRFSLSLPLAERGAG
jgi:signal transduction histidine kinase